MSLRGRRHGGGRKNELVFLTTCGPATTFDPKITGVAGTWYFDDGTTLAAASGAEISKTFAADGMRRAVYRPASGGLAAITGLETNSDLLVDVDGFSRMVNLAGYLNIGNNPAFYICTTAISNKVSSFIGFGTSLYGHIAAFSGITGTLSVGGLTGLTGSCDQLPNATTLYLNGCTGVTAGSVSHITIIRDLRIYNMGWLTADVDTVINSMWTARANYTYATPALQIGGTNQAPTGNVIAPIEGADWHQDGATWIPLTAGAKIYDLANNVNSEVRPSWAITYTA